jgi:hypothetical protein
MKNKVVLLALCAFLGVARFEAHAASLPAGCGSDKVKFEVETTKAAPPTLTPEPGMALVVFIESTDNGTWPAISTRFGMDDAWVGANKNNSYFTVSVKPGDHSICSSRQGWGAGAEGWSDSSPLFAQAGKVYFFESVVHLTHNQSDGGQGFHFKQITADYGRSRVNASRLSSWTTK